MALHLGSYENLIVNLAGVAYNIQFYTELPITNGVRLISSDNYILKDINGIYLTAKEED